MITTWKDRGKSRKVSKEEKQEKENSKYIRSKEPHEKYEMDSM